MISLGATELARRAPTGTAYREAPVRLAIALPPVVTRDGHALGMTIDAALRLVDRAADRALFDEHFPGEVVAIDAVRQHLAPRLEEAARAFAREHEAASCLMQRAVATELLLRRMNEIGFACGIEFLPPAEATLRCPSLEIGRAAARAAEDRSASMQRTADVLAKLEAGEVGDLPIADQAAALQSLLKKRLSMPFYCVAGHALLRIGGDAGRPEIVATIDGIGPLRSLRRSSLGGGDVFLIGGRSGVAVLRDLAAAPALFTLESQSDRGFNSAAADPASGVLHAAHTELGIARWRLETAEPLAPLQTPPGARHLRAIDERMLFAVGGTLHVIDVAGVRAIADDADEIVGLHMLADAVVVVRAAGTIERLDRSTLSRLTRVRRGTAIGCSALIDVDAMAALAIAGGDGPIDVVTLGGELLFELHGLAGPRMLAAAGDAIVAVSGDRQRVALWRPARSRQPVATTNVAAIAQGRITDLV